MARSRFIALCALLLASCGGSVTEVVLLIDSDFATPSAVDSVEVSVTSPDLRVQTSTATLDADSPGFPRTLGIEQSRMEEGEYAVEVTARKGMALVVRRKARFRFTEGERRMLRINLLKECFGIVCAGDTTCGAGHFCERPSQTTQPFESSAIVSEFDAGM